MASRRLGCFKLPVGDAGTEVFLEGPEGERVWPITGPRITKKLRRLAALHQTELLICDAVPAAYVPSAARGTDSFSFDVCIFSLPQNLRRDSRFSKSIVDAHTFQKPATVF